MLMPRLSEADPAESAEGSIDPLGMYPIADALASRMVPGVRERQTLPRFLTTIAVSLSLCSVFDEDTVADDGVSEPWQVFEWYVVEGLARATSDPKLLRGLPGRDKADKAKAAGDCRSDVISREQELSIFTVSTERWPRKSGSKRRGDLVMPAMRCCWLGYPNQTMRARSTRCQFGKDAW
ncbi:MAG TPA: hypothetical protein DDX19_11585 [Rhodopirellula baltica]|uniref:Uncharacterized protein n=1 Tax=Rhodopirellula baltica (strain DSM 10527 / NCIMB 13988 / SH1) TaxID=243090 RepID=Q7UYP4_RHOBA|nr:hypothetical protein [Rhodopirellula baltica]CAD71598.1 hypothetical protein RB463 [Rhodopirellula baltica SH 1]HBE63358.1 hypothetical protein [Rhodopirellula baltica]